MSTFCPSCGSAVSDDATICPTCGEPLGIAPVEEPVSAAAPPNAPPSATAPPPPRPATAAQGSPARDYLLTGIIIAAIAGAIFMIAAPDWYTVQPSAALPGATAQGGAAQSGAGEQMPQGHPPVQQVPPELEKQMADLEKNVAANPTDLDMKLKLANIYFDVERYEKAVPLYRAYVEAHPGDDNARTDMAFSIAKTGGLDEGIALLRQVIGHNPRHQNAAYNLSMMYVSKKNRDSAIYWLDQVVMIDSTSRPGKFASEILRGLKEAPADSSSATMQ